MFSKNKIFGKQSPKIAASSLCVLRKTMARKLKNSRFEQMHFHTTTLESYYRIPQNQRYTSCNEDART
jgi:hypothetical protein